MPTANTIGYYKAGGSDVAVAYDTSNNAIDLEQSVLISADGNTALTANPDQSALVHGLNGFQIQPGSSISLGSAGTGYAKFALGSTTPVVGTVNGVFLVAGSGGEVYYTPLGVGGSTYTGCARMKNITGYRVYLAGGGVVAEMEMAGSAELWVNNTAITTLWQDNGMTSAIYFATGFTNLTIGGGSFTSGRSVSGTLRIGGSAQVTFTRIDANTTPPTAGVVEMGSGVLKWRGGNITTINAYGSATLDFSDIPAAMTITTLNCTAAVAARSIFKGRNFTVTITNTPVVRCGMQDTIIN